MLDRAVAEERSLVIRDGGHLLLGFPDRRGRWLVSRDGGRYRWENLLPTLGVPTAVASDLFVGHDGRQVYLSDDGWRYRPVPVR